jgi:hypothetical protein
MSPFTGRQLALFLTASVVGLPAGVASATPPHVVLIVVDDLGWMDQLFQHITYAHP